MNLSDALQAEMDRAVLMLYRAADVNSYRPRAEMTRRQFDAAVLRYNNPKGRRRTHHRRRQRELDRVAWRHGLTWSFKVMRGEYMSW